MAIDTATLAMQHQSEERERQRLGELPDPEEARRQHDRMVADYHRGIEESKAKAKAVAAEQAVELLKRNYRDAFIAANPGTTEVDFASEWPAILKDHRRRAMDEALASERAALKATGRYSL